MNFDQISAPTDPKAIYKLIMYYLKEILSSMDTLDKYHTVCHIQPPAIPQTRSLFITPLKHRKGYYLVCNWQDFAHLKIYYGDEKGESRESIMHVSFYSSYLLSSEKQSLNKLSCDLSCHPKIAYRFIQHLVYIHKWYLARIAGAERHRLDLKRQLENSKAHERIQDMYQRVQVIENL